MAEKKLLELRRAIKKKKPDFIRQDAHKRAKLEPHWRKPRGIHSKMRLKLRGRRKPVDTGYRSPKAVRGLERCGLEAVAVSSVKDMESIKKEKQAAIITRGVGLRKKVLLLKKAAEKGIKVINFKDPAAYIKNADEIMAKKKAEGGVQKKEKERKLDEKKKKAAEKEKEEKKKAETSVSEEGAAKEEEKKKKEEKEEMDKLLTKKDTA